MEWKKICEQRPIHGQFIWVCDMLYQRKFLIMYLGSEETWDVLKNNERFPIWKSSY